MIFFLIRSCNARWSISDCYFLPLQAAATKPNSCVITLNLSKIAPIRCARWSFFWGDEWKIITRKFVLMDRERYVSFSFRFFSRKRGGDQICLRWSRFLLAHWLAIISIFFSLGGLISDNSDSEIRDKPYGKFTLFFKVLFLFVSEGGEPSCDPLLMMMMIVVVVMIVPAIVDAATARAEQATNLTETVGKFEFWQWRAARFWMKRRSSARENNALWYRIGNNRSESERRGIAAKNMIILDLALLPDDARGVNCWRRKKKS